MELAIERCRFRGTPSSNSFRTTAQPPDIALPRPAVVRIRATAATARGRPTQRGLEGGGDPMIREVVDGKFGPIAPGCVTRFSEDRFGGRPTTAHGLCYPLPLQRVDETRGIADEEDPSRRRRGADDPHL